MRLSPWPSLLSVILYGYAAQAVNRTNSIFGNPPFLDCLALWRYIMTGQDLETGWFDEEQLLVEEDLTWPGLDNTLSPPVVQLPKFFSGGMSKFLIENFECPAKAHARSSRLTRSTFQSRMTKLS